MSEMFENVYETEDDEQFAHTATYANLARGALFDHMRNLPDDDPWAELVYDVLHDAVARLGDMSLAEARFRPGMQEVGRAYGAAFRTKCEAADAEFDAALAPSPTPQG